MFGFIKRLGTSYFSFMGRVAKSAFGFQTIKLIFDRTDRTAGSAWSRSLEVLRKPVAERADFEAVVKKFNLKESDLVKRRKDALIMARIGFCFMVGAITLSLLGLFAGSNGFGLTSVAHFATGIGLACIPTAVWLKWSLLSFQIRHRFLFTLKEFLKKPMWYTEIFQ